jgi:hypothetical protein
LRKFYGEVPHEFCAQTFHEIGPAWHVFDNNGFKHTLTFNKHHSVPFLTNGWFSLLQHYRVAQPREITFAYFGNRSFLITVGMVYPSTNQYPSFHSYSTQPNVTTHFDITLTKYEATSSQLVHLPNHFYNIVICLKLFPSTKCDIV